MKTRSPILFLAFVLICACNSDKPVTDVETSQIEFDQEKITTPELKGESVDRKVETRVEPKVAALSLLNPLQFDNSSKITYETPFNFVENCQPMKAEIAATDPVTNLPRRLSVDIYRTRPFPTRAVLILPPTGGKNILDEKNATLLCHRGIETWIVTQWDVGQNDYTLEEDILSHDIAGRRGVIGVRQIISHMSQSKIGILGTSAGGILASVCLAAEPRISTGVLIVAGADMADILLKSDQEKIQQLRRSRLAANQWTEEDYLKKLRESLVLDPRLFQDELRTKKVGLVMALRDTTVPYANQLLLEEISKGERISTHDSGHFGAVLKADILFSHRIINFLDSNLRD